MKTTKNTQIEMLFKNNDWNGLISYLNYDLSPEENLKILSNNFSIMDIETIIYGLTKHIDLGFKNFSEIATNKDTSNKIKEETAENVAKVIMKDYEFLENFYNQLHENKKIAQSYAYFNRDIFLGKINTINKMIYFQSDKKLVDIISAKLNGPIACFKAIKVYEEILKEYPEDINALYRYATLLEKISLFSIDDETQKKLFTGEYKYLIIYLNRVQKSVNLLTTALDIYDNATDEFKQRNQKMLYKILFASMRLLNDYLDYESGKVVNFYRYFDDNSPVNLNNSIFSLVQNYLSLLLNMSNKFIKTSNIHIEKLDTKKIQELQAKNNTANNLYDIYYRYGNILMTLAKLMTTRIISFETKEVRFKNVINKLEMAMEMYKNVINIKMDLYNKRQPTGGFINEINQLALCYSILGINNEIYAEHLKALYDEYKMKRGGKYKLMLQHMKYYEALIFIYNKHTRNISLAIKKLQNLQQELNNPKDLKNGQRKKLFNEVNKLLKKLQISNE